MIGQVEVDFQENGHFLIFKHFSKNGTNLDFVEMSRNCKFLTIRRETHRTTEKPEQRKNARTRKYNLQEKQRKPRKKPKNQRIENPTDRNSHLIHRSPQFSNSPYFPKSHPSFLPVTSPAQWDALTGDPHNSLVSRDTEVPGWRPNPPLG